MKEGEMGGHVTRTREKRNACKFLGGKSEAKRKLGRPTCRWENHMDLKDTERKVCSDSSGSDRDQ
jgi:hypothetical protein